MSYRIGVTIKECQTRVGDGAFAQTITIPEGTKVRTVTDGMGFDHWAVYSKRLLIELSGNSHDPIYRFSIVPSDCVKESE